MSTPNAKDAINFLEIHYPGYYQSDLVAYSDDLQKILDNEMEEGSEAERIFHKDFDGQRDIAVSEFDRVMKELYEGAIEAFIEKQNNPVEVEHFVLEVDGRVASILEFAKGTPLEDKHRLIAIAIREDNAEDENPLIEGLEEIKNSCLHGEYVSNESTGEFIVTPASLYSNAK